MAVRLPGGHLGETRGEKVTQGVGDRRRRSRIPHGSGEAGGQAHLAVDASQQEGTTGGRQGSTRDIGPHGIPWEGRKTPWFGSRIVQKQTSGGFSGIACVHTLV